MKTIYTVSYLGLHCVLMSQYVDARYIYGVRFSLALDTPQFISFTCPRTSLYFDTIPQFYHSLSKINATIPSSQKK